MGEGTTALLAAVSKIGNSKADIKQAIVDKYTAGGIAPPYDKLSKLADFPDAIKNIPVTVSDLPAGIKFGHSGFTSWTAVGDFITKAVSSARNIDYLLDSCQSLTQVGSGTAPFQLNASTTSAVHSFGGCSRLEQAYLAYTNNITNMSEMFQDCSNLSVVDGIVYISVNNISKMFMGCSSLSEIPFTNLPNGVNCQQTFYGCTNITNISSPNLFDKATNVYGLFSDTGIRSATLNLSKAITTEDLFRSYSSNTAKLTEAVITAPATSNIQRMFYGQSNLTSVTLSLGGQVLISLDIFEGCSKLKKITITGMFTGNCTTMDLTSASHWGEDGGDNFASLEDTMEDIVTHGPYAVQKTLKVTKAVYDRIEDSAYLGDLERANVNVIY